MKNFETIPAWTSSTTGRHFHQASPDPFDLFAMQITVGKILALLIAVGYAVGMVVDAQGVTFAVAQGCVVLLLPLALIWFPEELGSVTGCVGRGGRIDTATPPFLVSIAGWFFLVGLPVLIYFLG